MKINPAKDWRIALGVTIGAPVAVILAIVGVNLLFHLSLETFLISIAAGTAATCALVMVWFLRASRSTKNAKEKPPVPKAVNSSSPIKETVPLVTNKITVPSPAPIIQKTDVTDQLNAIKDIHIQLEKMQTQMELISEILLSSPKEKDMIRENSSSLKKFKLSEVNTEAMRADDPNKKKTEGKLGQEAEPTLSQSLVTSAKIGAPVAFSPNNKRSPNIKIPASMIQEDGVDVSPVIPANKLNESRQPPESKGIAELIQLKNELEKIRERISSGN